MPQLVWLIDEAQRRVNLLQAEVKRRHDRATNNPDDEKLHYSQILTLNTMMQILFQRQNDLLKKLRTSSAAFGPDYRQLLAEIAGAQGLWRVFDYIFEQRQDAQALPLLDTADLIAHSCYRPCIDLARQWGLFDQEFREPPLTYLDAVHSPLAAARTSRVQSLGMYVGRYREQQLPVPITVLPFDHITSLWLFSALAHEVGHHLDQDLHAPNQPNLSGELQGLVLGSLTSGARRADQWARWCPEILADTFGILLGGAGFVYTMGSFLLPLAGVAEDAHGDDREDTDHPPGMVRLELLIQMVRQLNRPLLNAAADWLAAQSAALPQPADLASYRGESAIVAKRLFEAPFAALGGRRLAALAPRLDTDLQLAENLARALLGQGAYPDHMTFPYRLVPSAAQIALVRLAKPDAQAQQSLHDSALAFFQQIPLPAQALGPDAADAAPSDDYIRQLTERIQFNFTM